MGRSQEVLVLGSGLAGLVFAALMAHRGSRVTILEAHDRPGGFGHTFTLAGRYRFNAQLHYVWGCGPGESVDQVLQHLGLGGKVGFARLDPLGFDHMRMPGYSLDIPADPRLLEQRLVTLFPEAAWAIARFLALVEQSRRDLQSLTPPIPWRGWLPRLPALVRMARRQHLTLQQVFEACGLPPAAQTLLALQWPDFMLPPNQLAWLAWVALFTGYQAGAWVPRQQFSSVIDALVGVITGSGGTLLTRMPVRAFEMEGDRPVAVLAGGGERQSWQCFAAGEIVCNFDPQHAAAMIGWEQFPHAVQRQLRYDYSPSNFAAYLVVKGLDLRDYGLGRWNIFHSDDPDLNTCFARMYGQQDYRRPSYALASPSLQSADSGDCPPDCQLLDLLTVANYDYFRDLRERDRSAYRQQKQAVLDALLDSVEAHYIPNLRQHLVLQVSGTPTTNERFCGCPAGNSYGSSLTPAQFGAGRLTHYSGLPHFHFCNASSGYPGFAGTFWTGAHLYQQLTGDRVGPA